MADFGVILDHIASFFLEFLLLFHDGESQLVSVHLTSADKLKQIAVTYKTRLFPVEKQEPECSSWLMTSSWLIFFGFCGGCYFFFSKIFFQDSNTDSGHFVSQSSRYAGSCQIQLVLRWWSLSSCITSRFGSFPISFPLTLIFHTTTFIFIE